MKKSFLFACLIILCVAGVASAELTVQDVSSVEYLQNQGYSTATINVIQHSKSVASGEKYSQPSEKEYYKNPAVRFVRRIFMYLDPALDDESFYNNHDIHTVPSYEDL